MIPFQLTQPLLNFTFRLFGVASFNTGDQKNLITSKNHCFDQSYSNSFKFQAQGNDDASKKNNGAGTEKMSLKTNIYKNILCSHSDISDFL
jgi:hypothetical protein